MLATLALSRYGGQAVSAFVEQHEFIEQHGIRGDVMARVAPPSPSRGQHQGPGRHGRWSWFPANTVTRIVVISVLIGAAVAAVYLPLASQPDRSASQPERSAVGAKPTGVGGDWKLTFDDEFDGTSLDTARWSTGWYGSGITPPVDSKEIDCYDPAQVAEGGGTLDLTLIRKSEDCGISDPVYTAGLVSTQGKFSFTHGFIEARVWLPAAAGNPGEVANWPGVWTDGHSWPEDGEIDIAEGIDGRLCAHFHGPADPSGVKAGCPAGTYAGGWHTFAADWEPGSVTYYYDGVDIGSVTSGITSAPMFLILSYAAGKPYQAPATMRVDYMRVWQHP